MFIGSSGNITKFLYVIHQEAAQTEYIINQRYSSTLTATCDGHVPPNLYRAHSSDSSSAWRDTNLSSVQRADANRHIGSWRQAWSQWFFCSWHGLCLIGICRADWSSRAGYGNAPVESIKLGDTLDHMMDRGLMSHGGSGAARTEVEEWEYHLCLWV